MELETINKLYLELSQIATAKTEKEIILEADIQRAEERYLNLGATEGVSRIASERKRQIERHGYSAEHDHLHSKEEFYNAAGCYWHAYNLAVDGFTEMDCMPFDKHPAFTWWPFDWDSFKPSFDNPIRNLEKAGALMAALIDREITKQHYKEAA